MFDDKYFKSATSLLTALTLSTVAVTTLVNITPAQAQLFPSQGQSNPYPSRTNNNNYSLGVIPRGVVIPVGYEQEKILVTPEETVPITLFVAANIRDRNRNTLIPYGTEVVGQIEPAGNGSRFVAEELIFPDGTAQYLNANSNVVTRTETIKKGANTGDILKGAAIGAAAATVLSEIFGNVGVLEVLGGAGAGAVGGLLLGGKEAELVSIDPNNDLNLTLLSDLSLR